MFSHFFPICLNSLELAQILSNSLKLPSLGFNYLNSRDITKKYKQRTYKIYEQQNCQGSYFDLLITYYGNVESHYLFKFLFFPIAEVYEKLAGCKYII